MLLLLIVTKQETIMVEEWRCLEEALEKLEIPQKISVATLKKIERPNSQAIMLDYFYYMSRIFVEFNHNSNPLKAAVDYKATQVQRIRHNLPVIKEYVKIPKELAKL